MIGLARELQTLILSEFKVEEVGTAVIKFGVDNRGSNSGNSLIAEYGSDAAGVTNMPEAGARDVGNVIRDGEIWIKGNTKIANMEIKKMRDEE